MKNRFRYIILLLRRHRQVPNSCGSYILGPLQFLWNVRLRIQVEYVRHIHLTTGRCILVLEFSFTFSRMKETIQTI